MAKSDFGSAEGAKNAGFSQRQLQAVIHGLGGAAGDVPVRPEPVQHQGFMISQRAGYALERFEARAQDLVPRLSHAEPHRSPGDDVDWKRLEQIARQPRRRSESKSVVITTASAIISAFNFQAGIHQ